MLQKQLKDFLEEFKEALNTARKEVKLSDPDKSLFGGMGYDLPKEPAKILSSPRKEELDDFEEVGEEVDSTFLVSDEAENKKITSDADIVKAFYNLWVNLNYTLVEHWIIAIKSLLQGDTFGKKEAKTYRTQFNNELEEALVLLLSPELKNNSTFLSLATPFQAIAAALALDSESLFNNINSFINGANMVIFYQAWKLPNLPENNKEAAKAFFTATQFIFEATVKLEEINQLKINLEEKLKTSELSAEEKIKLIRETQAAIFQTFFGQKIADGPIPLFTVEEDALNKLIKDSSFASEIGTIMERYYTLADNLLNATYSLRKYPTVNLIAISLQKITDFRLFELSNTILQLDEKITQLTSSEKLPEEQPENAVLFPSEIENQEFSLQNLKEIIEKEKEEKISLDETILAPTNHNSSPNSSWIELSHPKSESDQNNAQNPTKPFISSNEINPTSSGGWMNASDFQYTDIQTHQNMTNLQGPEENSSLPDSLNNQPNQIPTVQPEPKKLPEINESEKTSPRNLETITTTPLEIKTAQSETHQEKTTPTILDIALYTGIVILLAGVGTGIGFLLGGIGGAIIGGILGAMASEAVIFHLMDKKSTVDFYEENPPPEPESKKDEIDNTQKNALGFNHGKVYTTKKAEDVTTEKAKDVTMAQNNNNIV